MISGHERNHHRLYASASTSWLVDLQALRRHPESGTLVAKEVLLVVAGVAAAASVAEKAGSVAAGSEEFVAAVAGWRPPSSCEMARAQKGIRRWGHCSPGRL